MKKRGQKIIIIVFVALIIILVATIISNYVKKSYLGEEGLEGELLSGGGTPPVINETNKSAVSGTTVNLGGEHKKRVVNIDLSIINPKGDLKVYSIVSYFPEGWEVVSASNGGIPEQTAHRVTWIAGNFPGSELSLSTTQVSYEIMKTNSNTVFSEQAVLPPVSHWKFENNAQDFQGNNPGNIFGNASFVNGKKGNALNFNGVNTYVKVDASYINGDYGIPSSFAFWVYPKSQLGTTGAIMHKGDASARTVGCDYEPLISIDKSGWLSASADGCKGSGIIGNVKLPFDQWSHVAVVFSNNIGKIYVNGQLAISKSKTYSFNSKETGQNNLYIGAGSNYGAPVNFFNGIIDEVKIWNYALSEQEVLNEYNL